MCLFPCNISFNVYLCMKCHAVLLHVLYVFQCTAQRFHAVRLSLTQCVTSSSDSRIYNSRQNQNECQTVRIHIVVAASMNKTLHSINATEKSEAVICLHVCKLHKKICVVTDRLIKITLQSSPRLQLMSI